MATDVRCAQCGAAPLTRGLARCEFCGAAVAGQVGESRTTQELLSSLPEHPEFEGWRSYEPPIGPLRGHYVMRGVLGVFAAAVSGLLLLVIWTGSSAPALLSIPLKILLASFAILAAAFALSALRKALELPGMPVRRLPACIVEEREHQPSGRRTPGAQRLHFATLELADGARQEIRVDARMSAQVAPGDYGLAFFRGGHLVDFKRAGQRG